MNPTLPIDDLIEFHQFDDETTQAKWVASQIERNLDDDELRHSDVIVINTDPLSARKKLGRIRAELLARDIPSHLAGVDTKADVFRRNRIGVTCTGIHRAKGNEAAMVYVVNAEEAHGSTANLATRPEPALHGDDTKHSLGSGMRHRPGHVCSDR